jgi:hypothetical protein
VSDCCCSPNGSANTPAGPTQPFRGTYYIDPTFAGTTSTGSEQNPFKTTAAAWAFALTAGVTSGILFLAPGTTLVENPVFPLTGDWEIACQMKPGLFTATITGTVTVSSSASARRTLTSIAVTNLTGNSSAGTLRVILTSGVSISGTTTLTVSGAGAVRLGTGSPVQDFSGFGYLQNFLTGAVSIAGTFDGSNCIFSTSLSVAVSTCSFQDCLMPPVTTLTGAATIDMWLFNCSNSIGGPLGFGASGGGQLRLRCDGVTINEFARVSIVPTGNVALFAANGGRSFGGNLTTNSGPNAIFSRLPSGLQVAEAVLTLLANGGTATGNAVLNVVYTDMTGTVVTEPVTSALNVAGALGSKGRGVLPFAQNGAAGVSWTVTGITVATGLSYRVDVAVRQAS